MNSPFPFGEIAKLREKFKETPRIGAHARRNREDVLRSTCSGLCLLPTLTLQQVPCEGLRPDMGNWPPLSGNSQIFQNEEAQYDLHNLSGMMAEIGSGGLRLRTEYPLRVGQHIRARADSENEHFRRFVPPESCAEVVWVAPAQDGVVAGLKFVNGTTPARTSSPGTAGSRR